MSFKRLDPEDFLISADSITAGAWTGEAPTLTTFFTSSAQEAGAGGSYYLDVYNENPDTSATASVQFAVAFGDSAGSGSLLFDPGIDGKSPSSVVFGQFQNVVLGDEDNNFVFGGVTPVTQSFYAVSVDRSKYKGNIFPGTMNLTLKYSGTTLKLTDNSRDVSSITFNEAGRVFQLVSGSNGNAIGETPTPSDAVANGMTISGSYGLFLPDIGTIVINDSALRLATNKGGLAFNTAYNSNSNQNNNRKIFEIISGSDANFTLK